MSEFKERVEEYMSSSTHLSKRHVHPRLMKMFEMGGMKAVFTKAEGQYMWDIEGNRFLDLLAGGGVYFMGRNQERINEACRDVLEMDLPNMPVVNASILGGMLAGKLLEIAGGDFGKVVFANSGSEATEVAIRFARKATGKRRFLYMDGAFHGRSFGAASMCGWESMREGMEPLMPTCTPIKPNDIRQLRRELKMGDVAAVIFEPVQGMTGVVMDAAYMREAETLCEQHGALLIVDEVQTGLGRTGHWFASTGVGVRPHIMTTSKALSGGQVPVAACLMRDDVYDAIYAKFGSGLVYFSTFAENNLAMAAALTTIELLEDLDAPAEAARKGALFRDGMNRLKEKYDVIDRIEGQGLMLVCYFKDSANPALLAQQKTMMAYDGGAFAAAVNVQMFKKGKIIVQLPGPGMSAIKVLPPVVVTEDDIEHYLNTLDEVLGELYDARTGPVAALADNLVRDTVKKAGSILPAVAGLLNRGAEAK
ncbi:MAG: aspartate aminotransferase family protein [Myxococcales bacterium]|nr:aspartate aminotransferase family protein [Myxococcales bacterium]MCB9669130.1 aspartate aminotransferase family protein [Alphaproteobacteria bacterium]MCB9692979.1 aspartate aminotransferase family protein [Alphaproteobacteria bacterium]